ncbi:MAG TPA: arylsulfatase [Phycisphaerae bacterium]|nr:arylsulfatase [Phycisphaerae bacterium]
MVMAVGVLLCAGRFAEPADAPRPNIVIIMADDLGFSDLGCYGSEIRTPNIDELAKGGLRFTQFYNTTRCCPTRAALLTGVYQHQAGVGHMVSDRGAPGYRGFLNDRCVTIAEALRPAGYRTLMAGKWHVGEDRPHWPVDRGFDRYYGLISGGTNYFRLDPTRTLARDGRSIKPEGERFYFTDAFTDAAVGFVDGQRGSDKPFFLYVAYTAPHWPLHAWPEDIARYRGKYRIGWDELRERRHARQIELGLVEPQWALTPRDPKAPAWKDAKDKDDLDLRMAVYAAQIDRMDQGIGRIMAKIRELGQADNTLVLILADNGGCAEVVDRGKPGAPAGDKESFLSYGLPWANASNTPFRLYKHWVHEGGIATPLVACWPKVIREKGTITSQVGHVIDLMATCVDVAGAKYPETVNGRPIVPLEGRSLLPILRGEQRAGHDAIFWEHEGNRAVRQSRWKLVSRYPGKWELYDLEADRTELHDLTADHPERVKAMSALYDGWAKRAGVVPWEELNASGKRKKTSTTTQP